VLHPQRASARQALQRKVAEHRRRSRSTLQRQFKAARCATHALCGIIAVDRMNRRRWLQTLYVCLVWAGLAAVIDAQARAVEWFVPTYAGPSDRQAILEIARRAGISDPRSVFVPPDGSQCGLLHVESTPAVDGNRVRSSILGVRYLRRPGCPVHTDGQRVIQRGNWVAVLGVANPQHRERWRIRDGSWYVDIALGPDVPYEDAVSIVLAIRHQQLVDRRPPGPGVSPEITYVDPNLIIRIDPDGSANPDRYTVTTGGAGLVVSVQDGTVELRQQYISMTSHLHEQPVTVLAPVDAVPAP
jgi:hypothetical protein